KPCRHSPQQHPHNSSHYSLSSSVTQFPSPSKKLKTQKKSTLSPSPCYLLRLKNSTHKKKSTLSLSLSLSLSMLWSVGMIQTPSPSLKEIPNCSHCHASISLLIKATPNRSHRQGSGLEQSDATRRSCSPEG
ncbi:hypothetical protein Tsubulata_031746, partial [Turnera subulata]